MLNKDQEESRRFSSAYAKANSQTEKNGVIGRYKKARREREERILEVLSEIKTPTVDNIGVDGSEAISVIALHSSPETIKKVLCLFEHAYQEDPTNIYLQAIPSLTDRILILGRKKQRFGTNWGVDKEGKPFLIPVEDFSKMNQWRSSYGLEPAMRPMNLALGATKYPLGKGLARVGDQKELEEDGYEQYSQFFTGKAP